MRSRDGIDLAIIVFKCKIRPDVSDLNILVVLMQILESVKPKNTAIVFTFCDHDRDMDKTYGL